VDGPTGRGFSSKLAAGVPRGANFAPKWGLLALYLNDS